MPVYGLQLEISEPKILETNSQKKQSLQMDLESKYSNVFASSVVEPISGYEVSINLKENTKPAFWKFYITYCIQDRVHEELLKLQEQHIISPVAYSARATPIVVVPKETYKGDSDLRRFQDKS